MKRDKLSVRYSVAKGGDHCGNCKHYEVKEPNRCTEVMGRIEAPYWCTEYKNRLDPSPEKS